MNSSTRAALLLVAVFAPMLAESTRARRNERLQFARGGCEPPGDAYRVMRFAYPASFLAMIAEGWLRPVASEGWFFAGAVVFVAAKLLKLWAITALGPSWTFRVVVVPGTQLVSSGPYRYLRHPNYVAVIGEFVGVAMMAAALVTGPVATVFFAFLIGWRVRVESRALVGVKSPKNHSRA